MQCNRGRKWQLPEALWAKLFLWWVVFLHCSNAAHRGLSPQALSEVSGNEGKFLTWNSQDSDWDQIKEDGFGC